MSPHESSSYTPPSSILVIGAGVFGLSTAHALTQRPEFKDATITVVDRSPEPGVFPARDASSIDTSRIIRADYADSAYAALAADAQRHWRQQGPGELGGDGRYSESGLVLVADGERPEGLSEEGYSVQASEAQSKKPKKTGSDYLLSSWLNVVAIAKSSADTPLQDRIRLLSDEAAISAAVGTGGGSSGTWGYVNGSSGWADAGASMQWLYERVVATGRVRFVNGTVTTLARQDGQNPDRVTGVVLASQNGDGGNSGGGSSSNNNEPDGQILSADLTILAAGAWTASLIDLTHQATATGQVLGYVDLTAEEEAALRDAPVLLNLSTGLFIIPPKPGSRQLKIARHAYGYRNPVAAASAAAGVPAASIPHTHLYPQAATAENPFRVPDEGHNALRQALTTMLPPGPEFDALRARPFSHTRLCWYSDTPEGDFIVDYHPRGGGGLVVATGCSGHGFKFLPVLGDRIIDVVVGAGARPGDDPSSLQAQLRRKWAWKEPDETALQAIATEDGSRSGSLGLILAEEWARSRM